MYSCSSRPKIQTIKAAQDDGLCIRLIDYHKKLNEIMGQDSTKLSDSELFFFKVCSQNYHIYGYTDEVDGNEVDFVAVTDKDLSNQEKLPDDDNIEKMPKAHFIEKLHSIAEYLREEIDSQVSHKKQEELRQKRFKTFKCESGEKKFRTLVQKTESLGSERIEAYVLIEDRKFPLDINIRVDGISFPKKTGERLKYVELPDEIFLSSGDNAEATNREQVNVIKQILHQTKNLNLENGYYKLKGHVDYSTDSGCFTSEEITISVHENELKNYQSRLNYGEFYEKVHSNCLNESKSKKVQSLYSELNLCKIQACKSEFRSLMNNEQKIAAKSGFVNKMRMRRAGEALHFYEGIEEKYKGIQRRMQGQVGCTQNIKLSKANLLGGYDSGIMCFVSAELPDNGLTKCQKSILSSSSTVDFFPELENGLINFDSKVMSFSNNELAEIKKKDEAKVEAKIDDPDVQIIKEQEDQNKQEVINWRIEGIYFESSQDEDSESN